MQAIWNRIETQLQLLAPEIRESLRPGASEARLREVEALLSIQLPKDVKSVYRIHDGQSHRSSLGRNTGIINGWRFSTLEAMCGSWLGDVNDLGFPNRFFPCSTEERYPAHWHPCWFSFMGHWMGPQYVIDLASGPNGKMGQILFWNDRYKEYPDPLMPGAPTIRVVAPSIRAFFTVLANDLEAGKYTFAATTGILWSQEMLSAMPKADLAFLKQWRQEEYPSDFPIDDDFRWEDLKSQWIGAERASTPEDEKITWINEGDM